jgi:hypothetical protein
MSDALSFVEIDGQHVELLPARTVLSLFSVGAPRSDTGSTASGSTASGSPAGGSPAGGTPAGVTSGPGGAGSGKAMLSAYSIVVEGDMINKIAGGVGGDSGAVSGAGPAAPAR